MCAENVTRRPDNSTSIFSELDAGIFPTKKRARHDRVMAMSTSKGKRRDGGVDSIWNVMMISTWLCIAHVALAMLAVSLFFLPHPIAVGTLAILVALAVLPVRRPFPRWGIAIARAITYGALDYFPMSLEWEDQASFVDAAVKGTPSIIGCEPHGVLPLSIISFADYCYYGADTPSIVKETRAMATSTIFYLPLLRQLWSWLGIDPISRAHMRGLLERGRSVLLIPGGVAECLRMTPSCEVVYLRKRFGFVKLAMQTGAQIVPAYSFGQTRTYSYWKLGPPLCSDATTSALSKVIGLAPMAFWGRWGTPMPRQAKIHTVVGKAIPVEKRVDPTNEEVAAKLEEFIGAVKGLFERHRVENGYGDVELVVL